MKNSYKINDTLSAVMEGTVEYGHISFQTIEAIRLGLTRLEFISFAKRIGRSIASLQTVIPASYSTLTKKNKYDISTSERMVELARLYSFGRSVFGDFDRLNAWLDEPSVALGGIVPFTLLDTSMGIQQVRNQLGRIAHGIAV